MLLVLIILGAFILTVLFYIIYTKGDHWSPKNGKTLSYDAEIVSCETKPVIGNKIKTTIVFSDGFKFISFKSLNVSKEFSRMTAVGPKYRKDKMVTGEMKDTMINKATEIHDALLAVKTGLTIDYDKWKCIHCDTVNSNLVTRCIKCGEKKLDNHKGQRVFSELKK